MLLFAGRQAVQGRIRGARLQEADGVAQVNSRRRAGGLYSPQPRLVTSCSDCRPRLLTASAQAVTTGHAVVHAALDACVCVSGGLGPHQAQGQEVAALPALPCRLRRRRPHSRRQLASPPLAARRGALRGPAIAIPVAERAAPPARVGDDAILRAIFRSAGAVCAMARGLLLGSRRQGPAVRVCKGRQFASARAGSSRQQGPAVAHRLDPEACWRNGSSPCRG